jgi:hypothetical protein
MSSNVNMTTWVVRKVGHCVDPQIHDIVHSPISKRLQYMLILNWCPSTMHLLYI